MAIGGRRALLFVGLAALSALAAALVLLPRLTGASRDERLLREARAALGRGDYPQAEALASQVSAQGPLRGAARLVAGEAATRNGRPEEAIKHYRAVPNDGSEAAALALFSSAELCREVGRLTDAESDYTAVLQITPRNSATHERLAFLLGVTGRRWKSRPHLLFLVHSGSASIEELVLLADLERPVEQGAYLRRCAQQHPDDVLVQLGLANLAQQEGRSEAARAALRRVIEQAPQIVAAHALLGELLVDGDDAAMNRWHGQLPENADESPDIWFVRGMWARRRGELRVAARCFWEAVHRAPVHRRATYQLGQVLVSLGETSGQDFAELSSRYYELGNELDQVIRSGGRNGASVHRTIELLDETGRILETCAWALFASRAFPEADWPHEFLQRRSLLLRDDLPQVLEAQNLSLRYDYSGYPDHRQLPGAFETPAAPERAASAGGGIWFVDTPGAGIEHLYCNGADPATEGARMFEQTGGGVGVLDLDGDGWADLYLTQGAHWVHGADRPTLSDDVRDRIYLNRDGRHYRDVTAQAGLRHRAFGQGCTVGDFDNDGFPDLYVANIGRNQLYRNNGDGTLTDMTDSAELAGAEWTTSCVIVDLNADGLPDLFDVNYVTAPDVYERICNGHACSPKGFDGTPDRLWINRGDGTFEAASEATAGVNSKGLGIVAFDLQERGRPCLFVANDQVPSFLLRNKRSQNQFGVEFAEEGFAAGLAFNEEGLAMAAMGIAADDVNGDGRIDFFVTTFKDEAGILYIQDAAGLFVDGTNRSGLRAPTLPFVGWGTQFLDADLDGAPDLVTTNGHVADYRDEGGEWHMRPQFFRNNGAGRFTELPADRAGPWFARKFLGRGLARLDWNHDGKPDFAVSNIGERASLVTNDSSAAGHFCHFRLHAVGTARDAIGAVVELEAGGRNWSRQLVAGDGFQASNERLLMFGVGPAERIECVRVHWPSGHTTELRDVPIDAVVELVERAPRGLLRRGMQFESIAVNPSETNNLQTTSASRGDGF